MGPEFQHNYYGSITPRTFTYKNNTYGWDFVRYSSGRDRLSIQVNDCLDVNEFVSLTLVSANRSQTVRRSDIEDAEEPQGTCAGNRNDNQEFEFTLTRNPLPVGTVELTLVVESGSSTSATAVPTVAPASTICDVIDLRSARNLTRTAEWEEGCDATYHSNRNARYYSFNVATASTLRVTLTSGTDPWLVIREGAGKTGQVLHENDDARGTLGRNSQIEEVFSAGTYTTELTTFRTKQDRAIQPSNRSSAYGFRPTTCRSDSGAYGCSDNRSRAYGCSHARIPTAGCTFPTINPLSLRPVIRSGSWNYNCISPRVADRYAQYYTLQMPFAFKIEVNLISDHDPYLNILNGAGLNGTINASDDNSGDGDDARITKVLPAGTYTLEVTPARYNNSTDFHLRIRFPQIRPYTTESEQENYTYWAFAGLPLFIRSDHLVRLEWITERFGGDTYKSFVRHENSIILHNRDAVIGANGRIQRKSAVTHVYTDPDNNSATTDTLEFSVGLDASEWRRLSGIFPADTERWG